MFFQIVSEKKGLYYETFEDKESLEEYVNNRKRFFHKKFNSNQAYIVRGEEIFTTRKQLDDE